MAAIALRLLVVGGMFFGTGACEDRVATQDFDDAGRPGDAGPDPTDLDATDFRPDQETDAALLPQQPVDSGEPPAPRDAGSIQGVFAKVSVGTFHSCVLTGDGQVSCWGMGLVPPDGSPFNCGQSVVRPGRYIDVEAGELHTAALAEDGTPVSWGCDGTPGGSRPAPARTVPLPADTQYRRLAVGHWVTCGIQANDRLRCWGVTDWFNHPLPEDDEEHRIVDLDGLSAICVVDDDGRLACSADDQVPVGPRFIQVAVGRSHVCGLTNEGQVLCWEGEAGCPACIQAPLEQFQAIDAGTYYTCGQRMDGSIKCWGISDDLVPGPFVQFSVGGQRACGLRPGGSLECWGPVPLFQDPPIVGGLAP